MSYKFIVTFFVITTVLCNVSSQSNSTSPTPDRPDLAGNSTGDRNTTESSNSTETGNVTTTDDRSSNSTGSNSVTDDRTNNNDTDTRGPEQESHKGKNQLTF